MREVGPATWSVTEEGRRRLSDVPADAARHLLEGRAIVERRIVELTGYTFSAEEFGRIWSTFLDFLSELFYSNGLAIMECVGELLNGEAAESDVSESLRELLRQGAARVRALTTGPEVGEALEQAVLDMFADRDGEAFEWLSRIAERFVGLCSLGLEASSGAEVRRTILQQDLVLDTDILLTWLCEAEPEHEAILEVLSRWRRIGGRILVLTPVLEEVATHAWIAQRDLDETKFMLRRMRPSEAQRYASNAFVRTFLSMARGEQDLKKWPGYIAQYRGTSRADYGNLHDTLVAELGVERLPDAFEQVLAHKMSEGLRLSIANVRHVRPDELDKADLGQWQCTVAVKRMRRTDGGFRYRPPDSADRNEFDEIREVLRRHFFGGRRHSLCDDIRFMGSRP